MHCMDRLQYGLFHCPWRAVPANGDPALTTIDARFQHVNWMPHLAPNGEALYGLVEQSLAWLKCIDQALRKKNSGSHERSPLIKISDQLATTLVRNTTVSRCILSNMTL